MSSEDKVAWETSVVAQFTARMIAKEYEAALAELNAALNHARKDADDTNRIEFFENLKEYIVTQWSDAIRSAELRRQAETHGDPNAVRCSFCGKGNDEVKQVIAGPGVFICNECIAICNEVLADHQASPDASLHNADK